MAHPHATTHDANGQQRYVSVMNSRTMGKAKLVECNHCGTVVALVMSKRGKWYTCEVYGYGQHGDLLRATPWAIHSKTCMGRS